MHNKVVSCTETSGIEQSAAWHRDMSIDGVKTNCFDADGIVCHMEMCMWCAFTMW